MEPARRKDELEGNEHDDRENVEGREVREEGIRLDAFESGDRAPELDFGGSVDGDFGESVGEDGDEQGRCEGPVQSRIFGKKYSAR